MEQRGDEHAAAALVERGRVEEESAARERAAPDASFPPERPTWRRPSPASGHLRPVHRWIAIAVIVVPLVGFAEALRRAWGHGFGPLEAALLLVFYCLSGLGITIGFHRYLAHAGFRTTAWLRALLTIGGSMAAQGPAIYWVAIHRRHHRYSDRYGDPHTPHLDEHGLRGFLQGFWNAHIGWMIRGERALARKYAPDLLRDRLVRALDGVYPVWVAIGLAAPAAIGYAVGGRESAWNALLWGGLARIFLFHHVTWSINSVCHLFGRRPFESRDMSTNNLVCALAAFGEGWHNNHHAFPRSARHGLLPGQIDVSWWLIRALERTGLVWDVRLPSAAAIARKRRTEGEQRGAK